MNIYPVLIGTIGRAFGLFPFSVAEILLTLIIIIGIAGTVLLIIKIKKSKGSRKRIFAKTAIGLALVASTALLGFILGCGINYNRKTFIYDSNIDFSNTGFTQEQLKLVFSLLCDEVSKVIPHVQTDEDGAFLLTDSISITAPAAMRNLAEHFPRLDVYYPRPKPVFFSGFMSDAFVLGVFSPFTIESNYNNITPDNQKVFTALHELAHNAGFMREDEANFIAFLAGRESGVTDLEYAAYLYVMNRILVEIEDTESRYEVIGLIPEQALVDIRRQNSFWWERYNLNPVVEVIIEVSSTVNDAYLKSQGQEDGVESYGKVIDLVMAMYLNELN